MFPSYAVNYFSSLFFDSWLSVVHLFMCAKNKILIFLSRKTPVISSFHAFVIPKYIRVFTPSYIQICITHLGFISL